MLMGKVAERSKYGHVDANPRQLKAAKLYVKARAGELSMSKAEILKASGYGKATSDVPHKVFEKPSFKALLDAMMPDDKLVAAHNDLMENSTDDRVRLGAVKLGYEVKGYKGDGSTQPQNVTNIAVFGLPNRGNKAIDVTPSE